jgi:hypothetical protein
VINKKTIPYIIIAVLVVVLLLREGCNQSSTNDLIKDIAEYKTEVKHYKGKDGAEVAQNKALMLENQQQIKALLNKNDTLSELMKKYKDLKNVTIVNNSMQIRDDSIPYDTIRIPCDFEPFQVIRDSSHYQFAGTVSQEFFRIDSLTIPDEQSIVFGKRKMGFLKKREYTAEVIHSNPLIRTTNIGSYAIKEKRNKLVISVGGTYGIGVTGGLQPMLGVHVGFPLIVF